MEFSAIDLSKILNMDIDKFHIVGSMKKYKNKANIFNLLNKSTKEIYFHTRVDDIGLLDIKSFKKEL